MGVRLNGFLGGLMLTAGMGAVASEALAQQAPAPTIPQAFENAFFENSGDFYNRGTLNIFFGPFPGNTTEQDARAVNEVYRTVIRQQGEDGPTIRTPDLENPFNSSLLAGGANLDIEQSPTPVRVINIPVPVPVAPAAPLPPQRRGPVRALF